MNSAIDLIEKDQLKKKKINFNVGDSIAVHSIIGTEKGKPRVQVFKGVVIRIKGSGASKTFTVRKIATGGIGVEKIIPLNSPSIKKIEFIKKGKVRRSKLYYLRDRVGKKALKVMEGTLTKKEAKEIEEAMEAQVAEEKESPDEVVKDEKKRPRKEAKPQDKKEPRIESGGKSKKEEKEIEKNENGKENPESSSGQEDEAEEKEKK